jgi:hypothetical protein
MEIQQRDILAARKQTEANPVQFGPSQMAAGNAVQPPVAGSFEAFNNQAGAEEEIFRRQQMQADQYTSPYEPSQAKVNYQRLEHTGVAIPPNHPKAETDPHLQTMERRGIPTTYHVPIPGVNC